MHGVLPWILLLQQNSMIWIPWNLPQNTNMFFQQMSYFYTLIMGLLGPSSWFEIMKFSQCTNPSRILILSTTLLGIGYLE